MPNNKINPSTMSYGLKTGLRSRCQVIKSLCS